MLDFFNEYAVDPKAEQEGRPFPWGGGVTLTIARAGNEDYNRMINARYEQFKYVLDKKDTPEDIKAGKERSRLIMAEVMAKTVLLGWTGPAVYQGQPIEYSVANAQKLLGHEEFQKAVAAKAAEFRNFRYEVEAADAKNSETSSAGTSSGEANSSS